MLLLPHRDTRIRLARSSAGYRCLLAPILSAFPVAQLIDANAIQRLGELPDTTPV